MPKDVILTQEGLEKLQSELDFLSTEKRREVAERIKEAREFGDIAENSEYDDAKNEQAMLEHKIAQLEERLLDDDSDAASDRSQMQRAASASSTVRRAHAVTRDDDDLLPAF